MIKTGAMFLKFRETYEKNVYQIPEDLIPNPEVDTAVKMADIDFELEPFSFTFKDIHGN